MSIRCVCPLGHPLVVPDELAGSDGQCPVCLQRVAIPVAVAIAGEVPVGGKIAEIRSVDRIAGTAPPGSTIPPSAPSRVEAESNAEPPFEIAATSRASPPHAPPVTSPVLGSPSRVYESRPERIRAAYLVATIAGALALLGTWPALVALGHPPTAGWVWLVLLLSLVEVAYALWLASLPDWSTLWIGMALSAGVAAVYALTLGLVMAMPASRSLPLGLDDVRSSLGSWSLTLLVLHAGLACAAGWISSGWRREYQRWKALAAK